MQHILSKRGLCCGLVLRVPVSLVLELGLESRGGDWGVEGSWSPMRGQLMQVSDLGSVWGLEDYPPPRAV